MKSRTGGYTPGERVEVTIERIVPGGAGLARGPAGVVLVELAAPGDVVEIEVESRRGGAARGRIVTILEPSPERIEPPCPWYGRCGGCDLQHLAYAAQLDAKEAILRDSLRRTAQIEWDGSIQRFAAPQPFGSRSRIELHADERSGAVGFFERRSNTLVEIDRCLVSRPELNDALSIIRNAAPPLPPSIHLLAADHVVHSDPAIEGIDHGPFWTTIGSIEYLLDPAGFFQSSLDLLPELIGDVLDSAGDDRTLAWDLFSGAGLFSLPLAARFDQVVGVEADARATERAARSAVRNGFGRVRFVAADAMQWLTARRQRAARPDLVVVDPPRTGLGTQLASLLADRALSRLAYVSCDPSTLARDLAILQQGNLRVVQIALFDLFPQTHHVETVVRLVDRSLV